jgi:hypothetical protein
MSAKRLSPRGVVSYTQEELALVTKHFLPSERSITAAKAEAHALLANERPYLAWLGVVGTAVRKTDKPCRSR